jgi:RNA polymerase sigma-70 factor (ECF subfamily)
MITDATLMVAARDDAAAFRQIYERYATRVHGYHLRRSRDQDAAYDLTAETFAQAWLCRARFHDRANGSAGPWLFAIARHVLLQSVRRRRLEDGACQRLGVLQSRDLDGSAAQPEEHWLDGLDEALATLPPAQYEAVFLRVVEDLGYDDVAESLDISPEAARVRVHRGLATLRDRIDSPEATR